VSPGRRKKSSIPIRPWASGWGHASVTSTLTVYGHVMPGDQKHAADRFAALVREA
jgi:hypothetical protein